MRTTSILLALSLLAAASPAAAQSDADRATARTLAAEAHEAFDRQDYAGAADRFARAYGLVHAPTLALGLARAQAALGKLVAAQETYRRILREGVPKGSPKPFLKALEDAGKEAAALEPRVPFLLIRVEGAPSVRVTLDDVEVSAHALGVKLAADPGAHLIRASADGFLPAETRLVLAEGKTETVTLSLAPAPVAAPPPPVGAADSAPRGSGQRVAGIVVMGVGAAGLALGAVMGSMALGKHGKLADECTLAGGRCPQSAKNDLGSYNTFGTVSTVGFVAGGAAAVAGLVVLLTAPKAKPPATGGLGPVIGAGYLGLEGRF
jgi:hypothetical protein